MRHSEVRCQRSAFFQFLPVFTGFLEVPLQSGCLKPSQSVLSASGSEAEVSLDAQGSAYKGKGIGLMTIQGMEGKNKGDKIAEIISL